MSTAIKVLLTRLGATVLERGWLSSNNVVFVASDGAAVVVDTGYAAHADQTVALVERVLQGRPLERIVNTHLHSDHCGGNAALQARFNCAVHVPEAAFRAARQWDESELTFRATGQRCDRFRVDGALAAGSTVRLGDHPWEVHACGGHDPDAVMLFEPGHRVLISGDALWEFRVPIIFEALLHPRGFDTALASLAHIESLRPDVVIPGHGAPFCDASAAIALSRARLQAFRSGAADHLAAARRSLLMFHFLEHRRRSLADLCTWANQTSVPGGGCDWLEGTVGGLVKQGHLHFDGKDLILPAD